ncbi:enterochelin esterase [Marinomonas sp. NPDC078689]|uniref:enterochelin esterase n=1 Tax=Marinomonas sp. NPDC078689 TaxID=3364147 RepID=UPI0037CBBBF5
MSVDLALKLAAGEYLVAADIGTKAWWERLKQQGCPLMFGNYSGETVVDFFWQDPSGDESQSCVAQVLLQINSVTDHHSWEPVSLSRVAGTDVWHKQLSIESSWRGSYSFIPLTAEQMPHLAFSESDGSSQAQRRWYISIMDQALPDVLNPFPASIDGKTSALHLPNAQREFGWPQWDAGELTFPRERMTTFTWDSTRLENSRSIYAFQTGEDSGSKPLVILLDGQKWATPSGTPAVLEALTQQQHIAPAQYLLIDSIDGKVRWSELSCHEGFWQAVFDELFPLAQQHGVSLGGASTTLVAGQSLGGLAALYVGLNWPERVQKVISLSGSFWWPDVNRALPCDPTLLSYTPPNSLSAQLQLGQLAASHLDIFMSVGSGEGDMNRYNENMLAALEADRLVTFANQPARLIYDRFCGGHDWLAWRSSLVKGLVALLPPSA